MILWCDGAHSAGENMRRDARLLARLDAARPGSDAARPVLRLFTFAGPSLTLGRSQRPERQLDLERCARDGVGWAVRPTGGRAVLHGGDWSYGFAARLDDPEWGGSLAVAFARISRLVEASLAALGVPSRRATPRPAAREARAPMGERLSCFAATLPHEIELDGRKLVGSAQRRTHRALLQQGSVLLEPTQGRLADYLALDAARRERARVALDRAATAAGTWLGADRSLARWAGALERALGGRARRVDDIDGAFLLTLPEFAPYTAQPLTDVMTMSREAR